MAVIVHTLSRSTHEAQFGQDANGDYHNGQSNVHSNGHDHRPNNGQRGGRANGGSHDGRTRVQSNGHDHGPNNGQRGGRANGGSHDGRTRVHSNGHDHRPNNGQRGGRANGASHDGRTRVQSNGHDHGPNNGQRGGHANRGSHDGQRGGHANGPHHEPNNGQRGGHANGASHDGRTQVQSNGHDHGPNNGQRGGHPNRGSHDGQRGGHANGDGNGQVHAHPSEQCFQVNDEDYSYSSGSSDQPHVEIPDEPQIEVPEESKVEVPNYVGENGVFNTGNGWRSGVARKQTAGTHWIEVEPCGDPSLRVVIDASDSNQWTMDVPRIKQQMDADTEYAVEQSKFIKKTMIANGDCFFESVARYLKRLRKHRHETASSLRLKVAEFMNRESKQNEDEYGHWTDEARRIKLKGEYPEQMSVAATSILFRMDIDVYLCQDRKLIRSQHLSIGNGSHKRRISLLFNLRKAHYDLLEVRQEKAVI